MNYLMPVHLLELIVNLAIFHMKLVDARGIYSETGMSCLYVAANFTFFPFDCEMPDLAFKCRCQDLAFMGTITKCIEAHAKDPNDLSMAYSQLIDTCKAQGGKTWDFIDLFKLNKNASQYIIPYNEIPTSSYQTYLVWQAEKAYGVKIKTMTSKGKSAFEEPPSFSKFSNRKNTPTFDLLRQEKDVKQLDKTNDMEKIDITNSLLYNPVIIPNSLYDKSYKSVSNLMLQRNLATKYGIFLYLYWGLVILIAAAVETARWAFPFFTDEFSKTRFALWCKIRMIYPHCIETKKACFKQKSNNEYFACGKKSSLFCPFEVFGRTKKQDEKLQLKAIPKPDLSNKKFQLRESSKKSEFSKNADDKDSNHNEHYRKTSWNPSSSRIHSLVVIGYLIITIVLCCVKYQFRYPNAVFNCSKGQKLVAIADRTGIIGTTQLPIVFLFSTRNNLLLKFTGWSYKTFQLFHRWTSRVVFALFVTHCAFYLMFVSTRGDYVERWKLLKWKCANTAFAALVMTCGISCFRKIIYEWFKATHVILLVIFSVGAWYHCVTLGWVEYLIAAYLIWGIDYVIRFYKIISSGGVLTGHCKVVFYCNNNDPHLIRLNINHSGRWKPFPGCYCWITFLRYDMMFESHPFTVVSATSPENYNQLVFIIRVKNGLTKRLAHYIATQPRGECNINLMVEGPYGHNIPFKQYKDSILIAGGVGMSMIYSMAIDLAHIYRAQQLLNKRESCRIRKTTKESVSIIWIVPNFECVFAFKAEIQYISAFLDAIELHIFVTKRLKNESLQNLIVDHGLINTSNLQDESLNSCEFENGAFKEDIKICNAEVPIVDEKYNNRKTSLNLDSRWVSTDIQDTTGHKQPAIGSYSKPIDIILRPDLEIGQVSILSEQNNEMVQFLNWLMQNSGNWLHINFEHKPCLAEELPPFIINKNCNVHSGTTSIISCGPKRMNSDVRSAVLNCLKADHSVGYHEEELVW